MARCSSCHGEAGRGDGAAAMVLNPKPRNLSDVAWQGSVEDAALKKVIVEGGAAVGLSSAMPPAVDLGSKPEQLDALVRHLRSLKP